MRKLQTYNRQNRGKGSASYAVFSAGNDIDKALHKKPNYEKMAVYILGSEKAERSSYCEKALSCGDS